MADDTTATPRVVTIDPEDREQVIRLRDLFDDVFANVRYDGGGQTSVDLAQKALRDLLPKPKPEEPTGLGAVAVDSRGDTYVRIDTVGHVVWSPISGDVCRWDDVPAVKIISEGVEL